MSKIINQSGRSFIVSSKDVIKGAKAGHSAEEKIIVSGPGVVEVSSKLAKFLSTYNGILTIEVEEETKKGK